MVKITTKAIDNIVDDASKLDIFQVSARDTNKFKTEQDYIDFVSRSIFTVVGLPKNTQALAKINYITKNSKADVAYLVEVLTETEEFKNYQFKIVPIIKLYESLLKENWETIKKDRDIIDEIEEPTLTPNSNVAVCDAIGKFLKDYVLENAKNNKI